MPDAVGEIRKCLNVNGLIKGRATGKEAPEFKDNAPKIFSDATFRFHKWSSNETDLEEPTTNLFTEQTFAKQQLGTPREGDSSVLGLPWTKGDDNIS